MQVVTPRECLRAVRGAAKGAGVCGDCVPGTRLLCSFPSWLGFVIGRASRHCFSGGFRFFRAMLNSEGTPPAPSTAGTAKAGGRLGLSRDPLRKASFGKLLFAFPEGKASQPVLGAGAFQIAAKSCQVMLNSEEGTPPFWMD